MPTPAAPIVSPRVPVFGDEMPLELQSVMPAACTSSSTTSHGRWQCGKMLFRGENGNKPPVDADDAGTRKVEDRDPHNHCPLPSSKYQCSSFLPLSLKSALPGWTRRLPPSPP